MARFVLNYLGGNAPTTEEEGKAHFDKYMQWLGDLGEDAVNPANPVKDAHVVQADGSVSEGSETKMSGFSVIEAESLEAAIAIAKACPFLELGGRLEVAQLADIPV